VRALHTGWKGSSNVTDSRTKDSITSKQTSYTHKEFDQWLKVRTAADTPNVKYKAHTFTACILHRLDNKLPMIHIHSHLRTNYPVWLSGSYWNYYQLIKSAFSFASLIWIAHTILDIYIRSEQAVNRHSINTLWPVLLQQKQVMSQILHKCPFTTFMEFYLLDLRVVSEWTMVKIAQENNIS